MRQTFLLLLLLATQYSMAQQLDNGYAPPINDFSAILGSGMYTGGAPNGSVPDGGWQHLLVVRHGNPNNNYQLQIGSSIYENDKLYFRKIADGGLNGVNPNWLELSTRGSNTFNGGQTINGELKIVTSYPQFYLSSTSNNPEGAIRGVNGTWLFGYGGVVGNEDISIGTQDGTVNG